MDTGKANETHPQIHEDVAHIATTVQATYDVLRSIYDRIGTGEKGAPAAPAAPDEPVASGLLPALADLSRAADAVLAQAHEIAKFI